MRVAHREGDTRDATAIRIRFQFLLRLPNAQVQRLNDEVIPGAISTVPRCRATQAQAAPGTGCQTGPGGSADHANHRRVPLTDSIFKACVPRGLPCPLLLGEVGYLLLRIRARSGASRKCCADPLNPRDKSGFEPEAGDVEPRRRCNLRVILDGTRQSGYVSASGTISSLRSLPFERGTVFPAEFLRR